MQRIFNSINDVYYYSLSELKTKGRPVNSITDKNSVGTDFGTRNRDFIELHGFSFQLTDSRNRLIYSESRRLSMGFNIANFLWFISGSKDVEPISFYNKKGMAFSNNGKYYEAAFGDRIFGSHNLIENAKELLLTDPTTRRALIPLLFPDDLKNLPRDTPCASNIQIMIRGNKIDFFLHMRSQSVIMVFPYDMFLFTMFHEYISILLNKKLGTFYYYANSFHYYVEEQDTLNNVLAESEHQAMPMESMPGSTIAEIKSAIEFEKYLRDSIKNNSSYETRTLKAFSGYWRELLYLLCIKAEYENDSQIHKFESKYLTESKLFV